ncbi:MAG TPA: hypothetical protein VIS99_08110 [Terrimicrobiaceae bacterium]
MIWAVNRFMHELPEGVEIVNLVHDEVDAIVTRETLEGNCRCNHPGLSGNVRWILPLLAARAENQILLRSQLGRNRSNRWNRGLSFFFASGTLPTFQPAAPETPQSQYAVKIVFDAADQSKFPIGAQGANQGRRILHRR